MKRVFSLLLLVLLASALPASYYVSNALGQKKESAGSYNGGEWVLDERGSTSVLYHNGVKYSEKITSADGWTKREEGREERVLLDSFGNIIRRIITTSSSKEEYNYIYSGSLLKGYNYCLDDTLLYKVEYITTSDGDLLYYREKDEGVYITDGWFVFESGERMETGSFETESIISTATSDGGYEERDGSGVRRYDSRGRLISEKTASSETTYRYSDDGSLIEKRETGEDGVYITRRENGSDVITRLNSDGVVISERRTLSDGGIEERRFVDGEAKYVFIYDSDGKRIREAYAL